MHIEESAHTGNAMDRNISLNDYFKLNDLDISVIVSNISRLIALLEATNHSAVEALVNDGISSEQAAEADDAIWILTSTFIIFTMQSGDIPYKVHV